MTTDPHFDGETYLENRDHKRLTGQLWAVYNFVKDGNWHSLQEIAEAIKEPVPSVSTRLRDLRKKRFGSHTIERRHVKNGLHEYRLAAGPGIGHTELNEASLEAAMVAVGTIKFGPETYVLADPKTVQWSEQQDPNIWAQEKRKAVTAKNFNDEYMGRFEPRPPPMEDLGALTPAQIEQIKYAGASPELRKFYETQEKYGHGHHVKRKDGKKKCPDPDQCWMCQREITHIYYLQKKGEKTNA